MKAIETKYAGPTNTKGSRYIASDLDGNKIIVAAKYNLDSYQNHERAAHALRDKMGWSGELIGGATKQGYAFVFTKEK